MTSQVLSCDWGSTSFRLRLVNVEQEIVVAETNEGKGIAAVHEDWLNSNLPPDQKFSFYKKTLLDNVTDSGINSLQGIPVFISGMASSSIGMHELPYAELPFKMEGLSVVFAKFHGSDDDDDMHQLFLFSGIKKTGDVMRGEETMLLGCDLLLNEESIVILPGTHSKHAFIKAGMMHDFRTYMTGEFFDLLSSKSILSKSVSKPADDIFYKEYFEKGLNEGSNGNLLNNAFHIRTSQLLDGTLPEENFYYLSGILIGTELKDLANEERLIHLVSNENLMDTYHIALEFLYPKKQFTCINADEAFTRGHCKLAKLLL
jgi:2-dehydro-3-deoxygalactonokinase